MRVELDVKRRGKFYFWKEEDFFPLLFLDRDIPVLQTKSLSPIAVVLKLGIATLLRVANCQKRVAKFDIRRKN